MLCHKEGAQAGPHAQATPTSAHLCFLLVTLRCFSLQVLRIFENSILFTSQSKSQTPYLACLGPVWCHLSHLSHSLTYPSPQSILSHQFLEHSKCMLTLKHSLRLLLALNEDPFCTRPHSLPTPSSGFCPNVTSSQWHVEVLGNSCLHEVYLEAGTRRQGVALR